jgi:hypothetical protein
VSAQDGDNPDFQFVIGVCSLEAAMKTFAQTMFVRGRTMASAIWSRAPNPTYGHCWPLHAIIYAIKIFNKNKDRPAQPSATHPHDHGRKGHARFAASSTTGARAFTRITSTVCTPWRSTWTFNAIPCHIMIHKHSFVHIRLFILHESFVRVRPPLSQCRRRVMGRACK